MKTAIVTGATSDIGQAIISELLTNNYQVIAIGRDENNELPTTLRSGFTVARASLALHLSDLASPRTYLLHPH